MRAIWIAGLILGGISLGLKFLLEQKLSEIPPRGPSLYVAAAKYHGQSLKRYSLGFDFVMADLLWLRLLNKARHTQNEEDKVSWEYAQLDAVTTLDRKFSAAYPFGAVFLSVFLRDKEGGRLLLEKWVRYNPTSWRTHYLLGYHLFFEMGRYAEAAPHVLKAASLPGAPGWLSALGMRLLTQTGSLAQALKLSISLFPAIQDPEGRARLILRIRSTRFALDKAAWENALADYRRTKGGEPASLETLRPYRAEQLRQLASLLEETTIPPELTEILMENYTFRYDHVKKAVVSAKSMPELEQIGIYRSGGT